MQMTVSILPTFQDIDNVTFWVLVVLLVAGLLGAAVGFCHAVLDPFFDKRDQAFVDQQRRERQRMSAVVQMNDWSPR